MNQPKFKIDDTVYYPGRKDRKGMRFTVTKIEIIGCGEYVYLDHRESPVHISHLELYQEPQKKKLYAFRDNRGWISFAEDTDRPIPETWRCAPEYDIEYPEQNGLMQIKKDQG